MSILETHIPDRLLKQVNELAEKENVSVDEIVFDRARRPSLRVVYARNHCIPR